MDDLTIISVDDHVIEPPGVWDGRVPAKFKDRAPRVARLTGVERDDFRVPPKMQPHIMESTDGRGTDYWVFEDTLIPMNGLGAVAGRKRDDYTMDPVNFEEMRPGCYDPAARVADMDLDGVLGSMSFPSFPRFCGQLFSCDTEDKELALSCIQGYNDWMIEEWAGYAPGRLFSLCIIPLWDPQLAVTEMTRAAAKGARGVAFSEVPSWLGLPSIHDKDGYWDPVFDAAEDLELPLCMHLGSASRSLVTAPDAPLSVLVGLSPMSCQIALMDWLLSPVFLRHPRLKVMLAEGGIGWIPYILERTDYSWEHQGAWTDTPHKEPPSQLFKVHVYGCFISDDHGIRSLDEIGVDNVMMETDYPHSDSTWPDTMTVARKALAGLPDDVVHKLTRGNAERLFRFQPSALGSR